MPKCKGVIANDDPREPPLLRCKQLATRGDYCDAHSGQKERQDRLRRFLKPGWGQALVGARGRPRTQETVMSVEDVEALARAAPAATPEHAAPVAPEPDVDLADADQRRRYLRGEL